MRTNRPEVGETLYHAKVEALWRGQHLSTAKPIVVSYTVVSIGKHGYTLNRSDATTGWTTFVEYGSKVDSLLWPDRCQAILSLYQHAQNRVAMLAMHPEMLEGHVSEAAALVSGLTT